MSRDDALHAEQLLHATRRAVKPTRADAARNFAGIEARLGLASGGASFPRLEQTAAPRAAGVLGRSLLLPAKGALLAAFGLAMGLGGYFIGRAGAGSLQDRTMTETAPVVSPNVSSAGTAAPELVAPTSSPEVVAPKVLTAESAPAVPVTRAAATRGDVAGTPPHAREASARRAHSPGARQQPPASLRAGAAHGADLRQALDLLGRAEAALRGGDGLQARMWLSDLDRRVAHHVLLEERLVSATLASCALGDVIGARQTLRELEQANAESMYRARLEGSCVADFMTDGDSKVSAPTH